MKGKSIFTKREVEQIVSLIRQRCSADRNGQKQIRAKMRRIGFYGQDDFGFLAVLFLKNIKLISWAVSGTRQKCFLNREDGASSGHCLSSPFSSTYLY